MNTKSMFLHSSLLIFVLLLQGSDLGAQELPAQPDEITVITDAEKAKADWEIAGLSTPQNTFETFMWSLRENNARVCIACHDDPEKLGPVNIESEDFKIQSESAQGHRCLAIRTIDPQTVDLKFIVNGWGDVALSQRLKKIGDVWKFDTTQNTVKASW